MVKRDSDSSVCRVVGVCPKHGACLFSCAVGDHKFSLVLRHDGMLVLDIQFLIFGGYLRVVSWSVCVPKKLLPKFDLVAGA